MASDPVLQGCQEAHPAFDLPFMSPRPVIVFAAVFALLGGPAAADDESKAHGANEANEGSVEKEETSGKPKELDEAFGINGAKGSEAKLKGDLRGIEEIAEKIRKSLVVVSHLGRDGSITGSGTGFVISEDGLVATCKHVIGEARRIKVELADGAVHDVTEVHAWDRKQDLAVLRIGEKGLTPLRLGDSDTLRQGSPIVAMGNPHGLEFSVVQGVVSAMRDVREDGTQMIQLAIPIEPGNSGSPLLDYEGNVHGVLTMKSLVTDNLGFATPVNILKPLLEKPNSVPMESWLTIGAINPREWKTLMGATWRQRAGRIMVENAGTGFGGRSLCVSQRDVPEMPYEVAVTVKLDDESGAAGLIFASDEGDVHYGFYPSGGQLRLTRFEGADVFNWTILEQIRTDAYRAGDWNTLRVRVEKDKIIGFVNGEKIVESGDAALREGKAGLAKFRQTRAEFRRFRIDRNLQRDKASPKMVLELEKAIAQLSEDRQIAEKALRSLAKEAEASESFLDARARELEARLKEVRSLRDQIHVKEVETAILATLSKPDPEIDIVEAALHLARLDNREIDVDGYRSDVGRLADEAAGSVPEDAGDLEKLRKLGTYLFEKNGFHGSRGDYYNRSNSYLNEVLDDREGIPITLSVLYIELARRIGVKGVHGVGLPGHFVVRYDRAAPEDGAEGEKKDAVLQWIDVFEGGEFMSEKQADDIVARYTGDDSLKAADFEIATPKEIITRMLANLKAVAIDEEDYEDALRYSELTVSLSPEDGGERLSRALLNVQAGKGALAKPDLEWLFENKPEGIRLDRLRQLYDQL